MEEFAALRKGIRMLHLRLPVSWLAFFGLPLFAQTVAFVGLGPVEAAGAQPWSARAPLLEARQEVAVAELDGEIYVIGGFRADGSTADTAEVYDPIEDAWFFAAAVPTPLHHASAASVGGKLYVVGGLTGLSFIPLDSVFEYDPGDDAWTPKAPCRSPGAPWPSP